MRGVSRMIVALICITGFSGAANAEMTREEQAIKVRKGAYSMIAWYYGSLSRMMKGIEPYDVVRFTRDAEVLAFLGKLPKDAFIAGSDKGDTHARPEIWSRPKDFQLVNEKFEKETAKLAELSRTGDADVLSNQLRNVQQACKSCHEDFKNRSH